MTEVDYADAAHRYRLDSRIATGGMGVVWKGTDTRLNRTVAVKVLKEEFADDVTFRTRFESEARSAAALHHPGIAGVFDYSTDGGAPFLVMEYVDGEPLSTLLARAASAGRTLDVAVVQDLMAQTAEALGVAHRAGIVHRDIKPANLMVTPDRQIKVTDFGIARAGDATAITRTGAVMGTPQYLSPEQARGTTSTPASDVYSLGVVAFECLAGRRPFEAETPVATVLAHLQQPVPDLPASVPADLAAVVRRAMAKEPDDRFADGAAFAAALRNPSGAARPAPAGLGAMGPATAVIPPTTVLPSDAPPPGTGAAPDSRGLGPAAAYQGTPRDEDENRFPWGVLLAVVLAVVAVVLIAWLALGNGDDETPPVQNTRSTVEQTTEETTPTEASSTPTTEDTSVQLDASDYIDRDYRVVQTELSRLGLQVKLNEISNDGSHTAGLVSGVNPTGTVQQGDVITVDYWGAAPTPTDPTTPASESTPDEPTTPTDPTTAEEGDQP